MDNNDPFNQNGHSFPEDMTLAEDIAEASMEEAPAPQAESPLAAELATTKDALLRLAADMENLRKRSAQEVVDARKFALQGFAKDLLPVADNLARALEAPEGNELALRQGVAMVAQSLEQTFARHGITAVEAASGTQPNPDLHQIIQMVASDNAPGTIVQVLQPGFTLNGRLLRPAMVTTAQ